MAIRYSCELMNICMIVDRPNGLVLVQHRKKKSWQGVAFPGGHVENNESFAQSVVREVREETGLEIAAPKLAGIVHWEHTETHARSIIACYITERYQGELHRECDEGWHEWIPIESLRERQLAPWLDEQLLVFEDEGVSELFYAYSDEQTPPPLAF
ncbi:MAG: 8-oxo-dGTP diphosphatase [Eubacteriales bacterium]|nr:8-oxo-dGTP diphosphatase [Eubacteriales bacterium]